MNDSIKSTQLTIGDLVDIRDIIDLACQRGAFRGEEMKHVGLTFECLTNFIADAKKSADAQALVNQSGTAETAQPIQGD